MKKDYTQEIIALVVNEKKNYEEGSREIRNLIKRARKNYACKFDQPNTPSGREKTFIPMTRWEVDTVVPKIFVNDKAVTVVPRDEDSVRSSFIANSTLKYQIRETNFPTYFKNSIYDLGIDGTTVFALGWDFEKEAQDTEELKGLINKIKKLFSQTKRDQNSVNVLVDKISFKQIDILNCFVDPTADSIQDPNTSFIFRNVVQIDKVRNNGIYNKDAREAVKGYDVDTNDTYDSRSTNQYNVGHESLRYEIPMVGVYERWGRFPKSYLTGNESDEKRYVSGVITIGDLDSGVPQLLRIDTNPFDHGMKPFEECWFQKKIGRWYGIGVAEKLIPLQSYLNKAVNRRIENEDVLHAGIFKVKRGSGINAKNIVSTPGGILEVENMTDIEQLEIRDISQLSDGTMRMITSFVERINGANEMAVGSSADRSATTSIIKDRNADTRFAAVRGYINDFLIRFFTQWLALDRQFLDKKFVLRVTGEDTELSQIDNLLGLSDAQRAAAPQYRFIDVDPGDIRGQFDLEVDIDQSIPMNKGENAQRLLQAIQIGKQLQLPRDYDKLFDSYLDMLGLQGSKFKVRQQPGMQMPMGLPMGQEADQPPQSPTEVGNFTQANVPEANQVDFSKAIMSQTLGK